MEAIQKPTPSSTSLFDVYLRLRPPPAGTRGTHERFLDVDRPETPCDATTHITITPPTNDHRKRAIEKFTFTKVFDEESSQLDVFSGTTVSSLIAGVLGSEKRQGKDGFLATLGVTGSGKSHTILGSKSHRGLTQMTLEALYRSIGADNVVASVSDVAQLAAEDVSEAQIVSACGFLDAIYRPGAEVESLTNSRAQTPMSMMVSQFPGLQSTVNPFYQLDSHSTSKPRNGPNSLASKMTQSALAKSRWCRPNQKEPSIHSSIYSLPSTAINATSQSKRHPQLPTISSLPQSPSIETLQLPQADQNSHYAIVVSMYEVYNDRIFDLLTGSGSSFKTANAQRELRRRALLFKSTEYSPDRKVVAGLRKIVCGSFEEALLVLEVGLTERRVAGTGSNAVSSRSHGFFCMDVKKRSKSNPLSTWSSSTLTIVDLAGSERARTAKTAGATLAEAGKINESLMYLGQCMQMQSDNSQSNCDPASTTNKPALVPFRQCKLTELLFSNSFHHNNSPNSGKQHHQQKGIMIVTADPRGDFNATSQILRYSALAREVTVPRIPSVTSTILSNTIAINNHRSQTGTISSCSTRSTDDDNIEITRLTEELTILRLQLQEETQRRKDAESSWTRAEGRLEDVEAEIREECWNSFEERLAVERERWLAAWDEEKEQMEGHVDRKLDVLLSSMALEHRGPARGPQGGCIKVHEDEPLDEKSEIKNAAANGDLQFKVEELERENEILREKMLNMQRDQAARTPSRKLKVLKAREWNVDLDANGNPVDNENLPMGGVQQYPIF